MKSDLTPREIERKFAAIQAREPEEATPRDIAAMAAADAEGHKDTITLEEYKASKEYSGKLLLRIPKELHQQLASDAKANGVSLNQYALYKLTK